MIKLADISRIKDVRSRNDPKPSSRAPTKAASTSNLMRSDSSSIRHAFQVIGAGEKEKTGNLRVEV
jgi:hypothetical protein